MENEEIITPNLIFDEDGLMKCPHCGSHNTHLEYIKPYSIEERPCVDLIFSCELCDGDDGFFTIGIQQHEGLTYLTTESYFK